MKKESNAEIIYTAAYIHAVIANLASEYLKEQNLYRENEEAIQRNKTLKELGFTNSSSYVNLPDKEEMTRRKECFEWYSYNFPGCIFLKTYDFVNLLIKYNLTCGRFSEYTGTIPDKNIMEIKEVYDTLMRMRGKNKYSNVRNNDNVLERPLTDTYFQTVFYYDSNGHRIKKEEYDFLETSYRRFPFADTELSPEDLFIAAPPEKMKRTFFDEIASKDPIVFQLFPYGVVIYSMWGEEANDPILKDKAL